MELDEDTVNEEDDDDNVQDVCNGSAEDLDGGQPDDNVQDVCNASEEDLDGVQPDACNGSKEDLGREKHDDNVQNACNGSKEDVVGGEHDDNVQDVCNGSEGDVVGVKHDYVVQDACNASVEEELGGEEDDNKHINDEDVVRFAPGRLFSWGSGELREHGHGQSIGGVQFDKGLLQVAGFYRAEGLRLLRCGRSHTVLVTDNNEVWSWGAGNHGQLGCGRKVSSSDPVHIRIWNHHDSVSSSSRIQGLHCGSQHAFLWTEQGDLYGWGSNSHGQLGFEPRKDVQVRPQLVIRLEGYPVVQVGCGDKHSVFLFDNGSLAVCGDNSHGQLGTGMTDKRVMTPKLLKNVTRISKIACGSKHTVAVDEFGNILQWGYGKACGLQQGDILEPTITHLEKKTNIIQLAAGRSHSLALSASGVVYSWGSNREGQLGVHHHNKGRVHFLSQPRAIAWPQIHGQVTHIDAADTYSVAITVSGLLYGWGRNSDVLQGFEGEQPWLINTPACPIALVACGARHMAAVTGHTDWSPAASSHGGDNIVEEKQQTLPLVQMDTGTTRSNSSQLGANRGEDHLPTKTIPVLPRLESRQKTKLTIEEFYAPTPSLPDPDRLHSPKVSEAGLAGAAETGTSRRDSFPDSIHRPGFEGLRGVGVDHMKVNEPPSSKSRHRQKKQAPNHWSSAVNGNEFGVNHGGMNFSGCKVLKSRSSTDHSLDIGQPQSDQLPGGSSNHGRSDMRSEDPSREVMTRKKKKVPTATLR